MINEELQRQISKSDEVVESKSFVEATSKRNEKKDEK